MLHSRRSADPTCFQHVPGLARFSLQWRKVEVSIPSDGAVAHPASNGCPRLAGSPSKNLHGWICTTIRPLRRRLPDLFAPRGGKWSVHPDLHGDRKLRGLVSYLLDDGPKLGLPGGADPPPPRYKGGVLPLNYGSEKRRTDAWCAVVESNHRPSDYESPVLPLNQPRKT